MENSTSHIRSKADSSDSTNRISCYEAAPAADAACVMIVVAMSAVLSVTINPLGKLSHLAQYWSANNLNEIIGTLLMAVLGLFWYYWRRFAESNRLLEIRKREKEIFEANYKKLKELEEMKDSLTQMIVHDMNGPLAVMTAAAQFIEMGSAGALDEQQRRMLEASSAAGQDMQRMVENLLDINAMEEGVLKLCVNEFSIKDALLFAAEKMRTQAQRKSVTLTTDAAEGMPPAAADKDLIMRVIYNLIANAIKYTPEGGSIRAKALYSKEGGSFSVAVSDNGSGIPQEYLQKIFDKFVRVGVKDAAQRAGRGLGLAFCKMAVEAHGGAIWAESEQGKGSVFTFTLPLKKIDKRKELQA